MSPHLLCADSRETLVLQRTVPAGVTKIRAFLDYQWMDSTCFLFPAPKWSHPSPSEDVEGHQQDCLLREPTPHPTKAAGTGMFIAWFMGSPDTNPFCSMRETLAHMHLACPRPSPRSPKR